MKKMELKTKAWGKEYIKNNFNGTETAIKFGKKGLKREVAKVIASENLTKPHYQKAIIEAMEDIKLNDDFVTKITKRNIKQKSSTSASNQAIDIFHKVKGNYAPERKETLNVTLTGSALNKAIQDKIQELKLLEGQ